MISIMLSAACGFLANGVSNGYGGTIAGAWLQVNMLLVIAIITITGVIYALSNLFPTRSGERLRMIARYEIFEVLVSIIIIVVIMLLSDSMCNFGAAIAQQSNYPGVFETDELYIGKLLFEKGTSIVSELYTTAIQYAIAEEIVSYVASNVFNSISSFLNGVLPVTIVPTLSADFSTIYLSYAGLFTGIYAMIVLSVFGVLFAIFLTLPIIQAVALTVVLPVAIAMRTLAFTGPRLRETSNAFIALAIGMFFVFPTMLTLNTYIMGCLEGTTSCQLTPQEQAYISTTSLPSQVSSIFSAQTAQEAALTLSSSFFNAINTYGAAPGFLGILGLIVDAPGVAMNYANIIAEYAFEGIVLIALDILVTVAFIAGINRGLNAISGAFGTEPFW
ncbi:MAG: hypothetical protein ACP5MC_00885 [Candidatus Micrarchaeia archaeon]